MNKKIVISVNVFLLIWFFLDMIGVYFGDIYLVTTSFKEDGIYFLIFLVSFLLFAFKENIGKWILLVWLILWFVTQFISHWWFTIIGNNINKINYFKDSIKLFQSDSLYIPDLYHIILHLLILLAIISIISYMIKNRKNNC